MATRVDPKAVAVAAGLFLISVAAFIVATPIGEGPDEAAHIYYVREMQRQLRLPDIQELGGSGEAYELHHPPLYYGAAGLWARWLAVDLDYPAIRNPAFPHSERGGGYLPAPVTVRTLAAHRGVWAVRLLGLAVGLLTVLALLRAASTESDSESMALLIALPFVLAPQLSFISSLVSNDGLLIMLSSWCLIFGRRLLGAASPAPMGVVLVAGVLAGLAIWTKASGVFLLPPLALLAFTCWSRGWRLAAAGLALPPMVAATCFFWLWLPRFEVFRAVYGHALGLRNHPELLLQYPYWWIQLWGSFFAKFTQFQLRLPWPCYFLFMPVSLLALYGLVLAWRERRSWRESPAWYWSSALLTNLGLLFVFMIFVDFQHQGRFLWPSATALVGLAALAARELGEKKWPWRPAHRHLVIATVLYFAACLLGVGVIVADEGWPPPEIWSSPLEA